MRKTILGIILSGTISILGVNVNAQGIVLDGTVGTPGNVELRGPDYDIRAEYGKMSGNNLFHSFRDFNLYENETATFSGPSSVRNIISRVTGGTASWIDGTLGSSIDGASLYFLNPSGIVFGPNAFLDLPGSFHAGTADYLLMGQERFYSQPIENDIFSSSPPSAFGFLSEDAAPITFQGKGEIEFTGTDNAGTFGITVADACDISIVGGDIQIAGTYTTDPDSMRNGDIYMSKFIASQGQFNIIGVASPGESKINEPLDTDFDAYGDISIDNAMIQTDGQRAGVICIRGGELLVSNSVISAHTTGNTEGGATNIHADTISVQNSNIRGDVSAEGTGSDILVRGRNITLTDESGVSVNDQGSGQVGSITIEGYDGGMAEYVEITNSSILAEYEDDTAGNNESTPSVTDDGEAGMIRINAENLLISGGKISSATQDSNNASPIQINGGRIRLDGMSDITATTYGQGNAGDITIIAAELGMNDNTQINTSTYSGGAAGSIDIKAGEVVLDNNSGIVSTSSTDKTEMVDSGYGAAGEITIETSGLTMNRNSMISVSTFTDGAGGILNIAGAGGGYAQFIDISTGTLSSGTFGLDAESGEGGEIELKSESIRLTDGAIMSVSMGGGKGGVVSLDSSGSILFTGEAAGVFSTTFGEESFAGSAGAISIKAVDLSLADGARIVADTFGTGRAGDIVLTVDSLSLDTLAIINSSSGEAPSSETPLSGEAQIRNGEKSDAMPDIKFGDAGNIDITASNLNMEEESIILVETRNTGAGGRILISADVISIQSDSTLTASAKGSGESGGIRLMAETITMNDGKIQAETQGNGYSKNVTIETDSLRMSDNSLISVETRSGGAGGDVTIWGGGEGYAQLIDVNNSKITSSSTGTADDSGHGGEIILKANAMQFTNGSTIESSSYGGGEGGVILLDAGKSITCSGSKIQSSAFGDSAFSGKAGEIQIAADTLSLSDEAAVIADTQGPGNAGDIIISADTIALDSRSEINTSSGNPETGNSVSGFGAAGTVYIQASELTIADYSTISVQTHADGIGGELEIKTKNMEIRDNAWLSAATSGSNASGTIHIQTERIVLDNGAIKGETAGSGNARNIAISTASLDMSNGSIISVQTSSSGAGGNIDIKGIDEGYAQLIHIDNSKISSASTGTESDSGKSGEIILMAADMRIGNGYIESTSRGGEAGGGEIMIDASGSIQLDDASSILTESYGQGRSGEIFIAADTLSLESEATITSSNSSKADMAGNAGDITIIANTMGISANSAVKCDAANASGGEVYIELREQLHLHGGMISTNVTKGTDTDEGGDITISAADFIILNKGEITANADSEANGGAVFLDTDNFIKSGHSVVEATSRRGNEGTVEIEAPKLNLTGDLAVMPVAFLDAAKWIETPCALRSGADASRFSISGRDTVPISIKSWIPSPIMRIGEEGNIE